MDERKYVAVIVEDDLHVAAFMESVLQNQGYHFIHYSDATQAERELRDFPSCDIAFIDACSPTHLRRKTADVSGYTGIDLAAHLNNNPNVRRVIVMSGYDLASDVIIAGAGGFLRKPFSLEQLTRILETNKRMAPER